MELFGFCFGFRGEGERVGLGVSAFGGGALLLCCLGGEGDLCEGRCGGCLCGDGFRLRVGGDLLQWELDATLASTWPDAAAEVGEGDGVR